MGEIGRASAEVFLPRNMLQNKGLGWELPFLAGFKLLAALQGCTHDWVPKVDPISRIVVNW